MLSCLQESPVTEQANLYVTSLILMNFKSRTHGQDVLSYFQCGYKYIPFSHPLLTSTLSQRLIYDILLCHSQFYIWLLSAERHKDLLRSIVSYFSDHLEVLQSYEQNILGSYTAILCVQLGFWEFSPIALGHSITVVARVTSTAMNLFRKLYLFLVNNKINFSL